MKPEPCGIGLHKAILCTNFSLCRLSLLCNTQNPSYTGFHTNPTKKKKICNEEEKRWKYKAVVLDFSFRALCCKQSEMLPP